LFLGVRDDGAHSVENVGNVLLDTAVLEQLVHGLNHNQTESALLLLRLGNCLVAKAQLLAHLLGVQTLHQQLDHKVGVFVDKVVAFLGHGLGQIVAHCVHCSLDLILKSKKVV